MSRPLGSTATPASSDFTATTGRSASERRDRYSMPPVSAVGRLPLATLEAYDPGRQYRRSPSHVPCKSRRPGSRRLHAGHRLASHRDTRQAHPGRTARPPGFDATSIDANDASTAHPTPVPGAGPSGTSSWSPPDASKRAFSLSLTTTVFSQRSTGWFDASPRRATPEGQQASISRTAPCQKALSTNRTPLHVRGTRRAPNCPDKNDISAWSVRRF